MRSVVLVLLILLALFSQPVAGLAGRIPVPPNTAAPADPDGDARYVDLDADARGGTFVAVPVVNEIRIESAPTVTGFSPTTAFRGSAVYATIVGTGFATGARVQISGGGQTIDATDVSVPGSTLVFCTFAIPATAYVGTWDVGIQNPGSTTWTSRVGVLAVQDAPTPTITGLSPDPVYRGSITWMHVNVHGTNFVDGAQVVFAGGGQTVEAFEESVEDYGERIDCKVFIPTDAYLGSWDVKVRNPGTTTWVTRSNAFAMKDTPTITGISPSSAPRGSTVTVNLSGTIFATGMDVCVFSPGLTTIWATGVTLVSPTKVRCTLAIPTDAYIGGYFVSIANPGMTYRVEYPAGTFTVTPGATPTPTPTATPTPTVTEAYGVVKEWGSSGAGPGQFQGPGGIAVDSSGNVYVADPGNDRVQKFDTNGTFLSGIGGAQSPGPEHLVGPRGVAVDPTGNVYIADTGNNLVRTFDTNGTFLSQIGGLGGINLGQMFGPQGIAVDSTGRVHVADTGNNRTQTFAMNGTPLSGIGGLGGLGGSGIGQFMGPAGIAVDTTNNLYVADTGNDRVQIFNPNGSYAGQIGGSGAAIGQVAGPRGVAVDNRSNVYVADTGNNRVKKFAKNGTFLGQIGGTGRSANGLSVRAEGTASLEFSGPGGVAIDSSGNVYVADTGNDRVLVFAPRSSLQGAIRVPGGAGTPTDGDVDGKYEDVNGNGRADFADVVLYFNQLSWITANEPLVAFDYNANGRVDFADVVWLFTHL